MAKFPFDLTTSPTGPMRQAPVPETVFLPLAGHSPVVQPGDKVLAGSPVARCNVSGRGDLHSPIAGTVREIAGLSEFSLVIDADSAPGTCVEPVDLSQLSSAELRQTLSSLGIDTARLPEARTLVINAMPHEPGISVHAQLLQGSRADVANGLKAAKRLVSPSQTILAGIAVDASALGNCAVKHLRGEYPFSLDPLVVRAVTGKETPTGTAIVSVLELYLLGRVMETGLPCTETVITLGKEDVLAKIGTSARQLFEMVQTNPGERDRVIFGGPMRGTAVCNLDQGIAKDTLSLLVIPDGTFPPTQDNPCLNCGECALHCPSRILPGLVSRAAEFSFFDRARGYGVDHCMECGLCGYHCPGRRPLLQYIRLAKKELAALDEQRALEENTLEMADGDRQ